MAKEEKHGSLDILEMLGLKPDSRTEGLITFIFRLLLLIVLLITFFREDIGLFLSETKGSIGTEMLTGEISASTIVAFIIIGFSAQIIDGALGMAYGVSSTTLLLSVGVPPAAASASVHYAEVFTTGISGVSHHRFGNVDKALFKRLVIPGAIGAALGAYVLTSVPGDKIKPFVSLYLLLMGVRLLMQARRKEVHLKDKVGVAPVGLAGGFLDAAGGGGWGPIVTTTLLGKGYIPRFTVGSVNASEFFVALAASATFFVSMGIQNWKVIGGLIAGGMVAAPLGAYLSSRIAAQRMLLLVGVLIILLSLRTLYIALF